MSTKPTSRVPKRPARRIGEKQRRSFAALSTEQRHLIAVAGGKASHAQGHGHRFTSEEARAAGSKGGKVSKREPAAPKPKAS